MKEMTCCICNGQIIEDEKTFKCSDCSLKVYKTMFGADITPELMYELMQNGKTKKVVKCVSKKDKPYDAVLVVNKQEAKIEIEFPSVNTNIRCLYCKKELKEFSTMYSCDCGIKIFKKSFGAEITHDVLKKLMSMGRTDELVDCFSKAKNKPYRAFLIMGEDKNLGLEFESK